jgi:hypothetical protein
MNIEVHWIAILVSAVVSMIVGFMWYGPMLFGKVWMKEKKYSVQSMKKAQQEMGKWYGLSFVASLVTAFVLSHVMTLSVNFYQYPMLSTGVNTAFWMWLGFIMPVQLTATIFGDKNWKLLKIDTGYQLASLLGMGVVLGFM